MVAAYSKCYAKISENRLITEDFDKLLIIHDWRKKYVYSGNLPDKGFLYWKNFGL